MAGLLIDYTLRLSLDPNERERFLSSPDEARRAMTEAGLLPAEQELLLSGDQRAISDALSRGSVLATTGPEEEEEETEPMETEPMEIDPPRMLIPN